MLGLCRLRNLLNLLDMLNLLLLLLLSGLQGCLLLGVEALNRLRLQQLVLPKLWHGAKRCHVTTSVTAASTSGKKTAWANYRLQLQKNLLIHSLIQEQLSHLVDNVIDHRLV